MAFGFRKPRLSQGTRVATLRRHSCSVGTFSTASATCGMPATIASKIFASSERNFITYHLATRQVPAAVLLSKPLHLPGAKSRTNSFPMSHQSCKLQLILGCCFHLAICLKMIFFPQLPFCHMRSKNQTNSGFHENRPSLLRWL